LQYKENSTAMADQENIFATALNCMDGRVQLPVNQAVRSTFGATYVDTITEAGIVKFLSDEINTPETQAVLSRIRISVENHGSRAIAVAAHHDCAGNPISDKLQKEQLVRAVSFLEEQFPACEVVGSWVSADWTAEVTISASSQ